MIVPVLFWILSVLGQTQLRPTASVPHKLLEKWVAGGPSPFALISEIKSSPALLNSITDQQKFLKEPDLLKLTVFSGINARAFSAARVAEALAITEKPSEALEVLMGVDYSSKFMTAADRAWLAELMVRFDLTIGNNSPLQKAICAPSESFLEELSALPPLKRCLLEYLMQPYEIREKSGSYVQALLNYLFEGRLQVSTDFTPLMLIETIQVDFGKLMRWSEKIQAVKNKFTTWETSLISRIPEFKEKHYEAKFEILTHRAGDCTAQFKNLKPGKNSVKELQKYHKKDALHGIFICTISSLQSIFSSGDLLTFVNGQLTESSNASFGKELVDSGLLREFQDFALKKLLTNWFCRVHIVFIDCVHKSTP